MSEKKQIVTGIGTVLAGFAGISSDENVPPEVVSSLQCMVINILNGLSQKRPEATILIEDGQNYAGGQIIDCLKPESKAAIEIIESAGIQVRIERFSNTSQDTHVIATVSCDKLTG